MNEHLARGRLLMAHDRAALAEPEFRAAIASDPMDSEAHACLALSLSAQEKREAGLAEAKESVALGPDLPFSHFTLASVLDGLDRLNDAEKSVLEAIRLDPDDADPRALLSSLHLQRRRWADALAAADAGLVLDPEHGACTNLRAAALVQLGRRAEAAATVEGALARNPENSNAHANQGWASLHEGAPKKALEHFREALRIDPGNEWARHGIVEAMKAKNVVYRWLLRWFLWISRLGPRMQIAVIVGLWLLFRYVGTLEKEHPDWKPFLMPLMILYVLFVVMTWIGDPLFNLLLRLDRIGRLALSKEQARVSTAVGILLFAGLSCAAMWFVDHDARWLLDAIYFASMTIMASGVFGSRGGAGRWMLGGLAALLALLGAAAIAVGYDIAPGEATRLWTFYIYGFVGFTWFAVGASVRRPG